MIFWTDSIKLSIDHNQNEDFEWKIESNRFSEDLAKHDLILPTGREGLSFLRTYCSGDCSTGSTTSAIIENLDTSVEVKCLSFWYRRDSIKSDQANVIVYDDKNITEFKNLINNYGENWIYSQLEVSGNKLAIKASRGSSSKMSISDLSLKLEGCPLLGSCDFDIDLCSYSHDLSANGRWLRGQGRLFKPETIPGYKKYFHNFDSNFMYMDLTSTSESPVTAILESTILEPAKYRLMLDIFSIANVNDNQFKILIKHANDAEELIWTLKKNETKNGVWQPILIDLNANNSFKIIFMFESSDQIESNFFAFDEVNLMDEFCQFDIGIKFNKEELPDDEYDLSQDEPYSKKNLISTIFN